MHGCHGARHSGALYVWLGHRDSSRSGQQMGNIFFCDNSWRNLVWAAICYGQHTRLHFIEGQAYQEEILISTVIWPSNKVVMHIAKICRDFLGGPSCPQLAAVFTGHATYQTLMGCSGSACQQSLLSARGSARTTSPRPSLKNCWCPCISGVLLCMGLMVGMHH